MRAKAVADGQLVEILVLHINRTVGTQIDREIWEWKNQCKHKGMSDRKIRRNELKCYADRTKSREVPESKLPRKAAIVLYVPVPQTDTGR